MTIELLPDSSEGSVNLHGKYTTWANWLGHTPTGGRSDQATVSITNNDQAPGITIAPASATEGDTSSAGMTFTVSLGTTINKPVQVSWATSDGTATAGQDYTAVTGGVVTIPANSTSATFTVSVTDDTTDEPDETFNVTISLQEPDLTDGSGSAPPEVAIVGGDTATVLGTIVDDDPVVVTVLPKEDSVTEGQDAAFFLTRTGYTEEELSVRVRLRTPGGVKTLSAEFDAGAAAAQLSVKTVDNDLVDYPSARDYTIEVLGDGDISGEDDEIYTPGDPGAATVTVTDNDRLQIMTVHAVDPFPSKGEGASYIFRRTGDISQPLAFRYYRGQRHAVAPIFYNTEYYPHTTSVFEANQAELIITAGPLGDDPFWDIYYPWIYKIKIYGDGELFGLDRVWKAGTPNTAMVIYYDDDGPGGLYLQAVYPHSGQVGQTIHMDFSVLNADSEDTGDTIAVSSVQRESGDNYRTAPPEPRVACNISGPLAPGQTGACRASFILTEQDLTDSPLLLDASAREGTATSNRVNMQLRVLRGVAVGFTETDRLSVNEPVSGEANARAVLPVNRVGELGEEIQVAYTIEPIRTQNRPYPPVEGADYVDNSATPGVLTFAANQTAKNITIDILGDEIDENRERFRVTLVPPESVLVEAARRDRIVVIVDNAPPSGSYRPTASLQLVSSSPVPENEGPVEFAVVLNRVWGRDAQYEVGLIHDQLTATPALADLGIEGDFEDPAIVRVHIPAGQTRFEFSVILHDDDVREEDETFQLELGSSYDDSFKTIGTAYRALATIADNDLVAPTGVELTLTHNNRAFDSVAEDSNRQDIAVTASFSDIRWPADAPGAPLRPADPRNVDTIVRVTFDGPNSTAILTDIERFQVEDSQGTFQEVEYFDIVIPAGRTSGTTTLRFKPADNDIDGEDETVTLQGTELVAADSDEFLPVSSASFTITDDDIRGITITTSIVADSGAIFMDEGETFTYALVLDSQPTGPVTIAPARRNTDDFISLQPASLTFTPSNWSIPQEVVVTALEDGSKDPSYTNAYITHQVSGGDYASETVNDIYVTITDTTHAYIYLEDAQAFESDGHIEFKVSVQPVLPLHSISVRYATVDGAAVAGTDYTREVNTGETFKLFTIPANRGMATIRIPITDDQVYEAADKTFTLQLSHNSRANFAGDATSLAATGTIVDDDPKPVVSVAGPAGDLSYVSEDATGPVTFTLTLTGRSATDVTVDYATGAAQLLSAFTSRQGVTRATAGEDYTAATGSVTFSPGETTKQVTVQLTNDDMSEDTEFFGFKISNVQNAQLPNEATEQVADVGLLDDDPRGVLIEAISIGLEEPASGETAVASSYTVRLKSTPTDAVTVTIGGGSDSVVTLSATTLTFNADNWATAQRVTVTPLKDANAMGETITLTHTLSGGDYTGIPADSVTINVTDSDTRNIVLSPTSLTVTEEEAAGTSYTVKLATEPSNTVTVTLSGHNGTALSISGTTLSSDQLTFTADNWATAQTVTVKAAHDDNAVGESETLAHTASGGDYAYVTADLPITVNDDAPTTVTAQFGAASYTVAESDDTGTTEVTENTVEVTVTLSADPERTVVIPIETANQGGATAADYSGVPGSVTFTSSDTSRTFTFTAEADDDDDDGESVRLSFGSSLPADVTAGTPAASTVSITDDDVPSITVSFGAASYTVAESDDTGTAEVTENTVEVTVTLSADPERTVVIPIEKTDQGEATAADYSGVPQTVTFNAGDTSMTFTFTAEADNDNDDDESVRLSFGASLPADVTAGTPDQATVSITDDDVPAVTVSFGQSAYTVAEGSSRTVTVELSADPERTVVIPIEKTDQNGATAADYSGVPQSVTFDSGETSKAFTFTAEADDDDDDDESVLLRFGAGLPAGVTAGTPDQATVTITDDDVPGVTAQFGQSAYTVAEGGAQTVTVTLSADPERTVIIPIETTDQGGAAAADYSGVPASVTFTSGGDTSMTFTFEATQDEVDDDDESVRLSFGASLPADVTAGTPNTATVSITDDDVPAVTVSFGAASYAVAEGSSRTVTVELSADPERTVVIPIETTDQGGAAAADYSGVPTSVTFISGETSKAFTFEATQDEVNDDNESVLLGFGAMTDARVSQGNPSEAMVSITDDDVPAVTAQFGQSAYTVAEGSSRTITVELSADPERTVVIPIETTDLEGAAPADYSGVPASVTFTSGGDTSMTFTFEATQDEVDDDDESVRLSFGASLPADVTAGTPNTATVSITDDDVPAVTVSFGAASYAVAEGSSRTVTVELSADPERTVIIPIETTDLEGAAPADYSGVPASVTFTSGGDTSMTFTFEATQDEVDDDDESVRLSFGASLPADVTAGTPNTATVSITDDDVPAVTVSFGAASYAVAEGSSRTVTVELSADPERTVVIPIETTDQGGAATADYSGVPTSVTFISGETSKAFTFEATQDEVDDDDESVRLSFGASLPADVTAGTPNTATVSITDDDVPAVTVSFGAASYAVAEGSSRTVTVELSADPERTVVIPIETTDQGGAATADYSGVPTSVTFISGETSKAFTFEATQDEVDDDNESVLLGFGAMTDARVSQGNPSEAMVSITDDDVPAVTAQFGQSAYTVAADYSGVPQSVTFTSGDTSRAFTFTAEADNDDDDGESVRLSFGSGLPAGVTAGTPAASIVTITDDDVPAVTAQFGQSAYTVAEGSSRTVTVGLSADPERAVIIPIVTTNQGGAAAADYSGVPQTVTFTSGETSKAFTFEATQDEVDDDDESVRLSFGAGLPAGVTAGTPGTSIVTITDDDVPGVTVQFGQSAYTVAEGGAQTVTVTLSADPERTVIIPIVTANRGGAAAADYSGVPGSVTFTSGDTSRAFTVAAEADDDDDDGESVRLSFGASLPAGVTAGTPGTSIVTITDDDAPSITVNFGAASYTVAESDDTGTAEVTENTVEVTVTLSADPERTVVIPIEATNLNGATAVADYSGVPQTVTFTGGGDTSMSFTFTAAHDTLDDDNEGVRLNFGSTLPAGVTAGTPNTTTVTITDDDVPGVTVSFGAASYTVAESDDTGTANMTENTVEVTVTLSADPERTVVIPIETANQGGATAADYSGVPGSVTFTSGDTSRTFTFTAEADDDDDDDGESVRLSFGSSLPADVTAGTPAASTVSITDDDVPSITVSFGAASYTVAESDDTGTAEVTENTVEVTVTLSADPERTVVIPIEKTDQGEATAADYSGVPQTVTFNAGDTSMTFTFTAEADNDNDDDESVRLSFGASLPADVTAGTPDQATVSITDDDVPAVTVSFGQSAYTVAEGSSRTVTVELSADPERTVVIPIEKTDQNGATAADYSGVPQSVTFDSGETSKAFTFTAEADDDDDDDESVLLRFGAGLPAGVTAGTPDQATVTITDDDVPGVTAQFGQSAYTVAEGGAQTVTVTLSADPERTVIIPIETTDQGGAAAADYSGVPASVTFTSGGDTSMTFTFEATQDEVDDDDESVRLSFGASLPADVTAGTPNTATVSITDDDVPAVTVSFGAASYAVAEGSSRTVTVELSADPERTVVIPIETTDQGGAAAADYSGVPTSVTFISGETSKAFTFEATQDEVNDDNESVLLGFGAMTDARVSQGNPSEAMVSITDDDVPAVTAQFGQSAYTVAEGSSRTITVELSADPERTVVIPIETTDLEGAAPADYSGVPASVTFTSGGDTSMTFTFEATQDEVDDDDESVRLSFGASLPADVTAGTPNTATVSITDDDVPAVTVSFGAASYAVAEGSSRTVTVELSADPERTVIIPIETTDLEGAAPADYSGVPASVTFTSGGDTSMTFTFEATQDEVDDDDESVRLSFGASLPADVTAGTPNTATVSITDDDVPAVTVSFGAASYAVAEGSSRTVTVELSADPERTVVIPIETTDQGGAATADYSGVPTSVTFISGETSKAFTFEATQDEVNDDNESVLLGFGAMTDARVSQGNPSEAMVSITDDDVPAVTAQFGQSAYTVAEGSSRTITVELSADPERTVVIPIETTDLEGAAPADYSGVPASVTFISGETSKAFTFEATQDEVDDDDESVRLSFGASLPADVTAGTPAASTVTITDDDAPSITVSFGSATYTVAESDDTGTANVTENTVEVTVTLSADPERTVIIPIVTANQGGATAADYSGVPPSVTFTSSDTAITFTFTAEADDDDDDDESVRLSFGASLPADVTAGTPDQATVSITDDDVPAVTAQFGQSAYTVAEGSSRTITVELSADPERTVVIPIETTDLEGAAPADYSGVPQTVTFNAGDTSRAFTFEATQDEVNDDNESVLLGFGAMTDARVSQGNPSEATVSITDDDVPAVTVQFGQSAYTVAEGGAQTVTVTLSADPERTVIIPIVTTNQGGATAADYSGVPGSVTFTSGDTSRTFTFEATQDEVDDDDESVRLSFGASLPPGVTAGTPNTATVTITDDDAPSITVMFGAASYTVAESDDTGTANVTENTVEVTVTLSADPERTVVIPIETANQGGASAADYSGVPQNVTFTSGDISRTFTFTAEADDDDDDGESVRLTFGASLPAGVTAGTPAASIVSITDDDAPSITVSFGAASYTVAESDDTGTAEVTENTVEVTVALSADPERTVVIPIEKTDQNGATAADYSGVPQSVTFTSGDTAMTFTFTAEADNVNGESVRLSFGASLPADVTAGTPAASIVTIADDDVPGVTVSFGAASYAVAESDDTGTANVTENTVEVTVALSADPERTVVIPIEKTNQGGATAADYSGVPTSVTFTSGETSKAFTFEATQDEVNDDNESVLLGFGAMTDARVSQGNPSEATVTITDDDVPAVTVSFGQSAYTVAEGSSRTVTVELSADPERTVVIPIETANQGGATAADYSGVPQSVTFTSGDSSRTFTFTAEADNVNDDGESVRLSFGSGLPAGVTAGTPNTATVTITDDDAPSITVSFGAASYTVAESDDTGTTEVTENTVEVTVTLSADPERTVVIPIETANQGGATAVDYSGVPQTVTFTSGDTSRTFTFTAEADNVNDDDESVRLTFGASLPADVTAGTPATSIVTITDDDVPAVTVQFGQSAYTVAEGGAQTVTVTLSADPERTVVIPIKTADQGGVTAADYSGVPQTVTFTSGDTSMTFTFTAEADDVNDDGESVRLSFGASLPADVTAGTPGTSIVTITDDDVPAVTVSFGAASYTVAEGSSRTVTVELSADPERTVVIPIEKTNQGGATAADYSGVPGSVTMNAGQTTRTFEFMAMDDPSADTGKSVKLSFGTMPDARVSEGSPDEATMTIRQTSTTFSLTCMTSVWCADLGFADQSALDWGWAWLVHGNGIDPTSTLSDDSFTFRGVEYRVERIDLRAGTYPTLANAWSREEQNRSRFQIVITPARQFTLPSRDHYRDWVLHVAGLQFPFKDAFASDYGRFAWLDADLQELYNDWNTDTVTKIGIEEVAAADQPPNPAVPWLPMAFEASPSGPDKLRISWLRPHWRPGLPAPTGYIVQWKLASAGWSDQDAVSEREVRSGRGGSVIVEGLTENMLYSARIFAFNDAGDGPVSDDALARTQGHSPRLESMSVNGSTLTMRYREQLDPPSAPATTSFVVLVEAGLREVTQVEVSGREVILTLAIPVHADNYVQARYEEPNDRMATFLRDTNGNHVESTSRMDTVPDVVNETPRMDLQPLTGGFSNFPSSHDGWAPFTFNVDFSDQVWISLGLPRDDMLEVEGGTVTTAHRVERLSRQWAVTIQPETRGDIVITLPGGFCTVLYDSRTAAMEVPGAPCAPGNRALSNQPTVTIPGPDSPQQQVVENSQAEGAPRIVGTPEVGQTLSADDTGIADADGLTGAVFSHQWLADAAEVAGATGSTHTLTDDDLGKAIKVRVTFTDDGGNEESLTSASTAAVTAAAGLELQSATVDGSTLTLIYNATLDMGVILPKTAFAVNVSGSSHLVVGAGLGQSSVLLSLFPAVEAGDTVTVDYTVPSGSDVVQDTQGRKADAFTGQVVTNNTAPAPAPGSPTGLQVARHGSGKLLASWTAPDSGPAPTGYTVQWKESGDDWADQDDVSEADATGTSHIVAGLTDGVEYAVRVIATTDDADSDPSGEVTATPAETTPPELSSATVDGATLTLAYDEQLDIGEAPDRSAFAVTVTGSGRGVDTVAVSGSVVTLTLVTAVVAEDTVIVDYTAPTDESAARLKDLSGNAAPSFSGQAVTNDTAPEQPLEPSQTERSPQDILGSPTGLQVARHGSGKLVASWIAPDTGPVPTGYTVRWKESGDDWADRNDVSEAHITNGFWHIITGLTDGTEYAVRVIATTDDAESEPSSEVTATPAETTPPELSSASVDGATLTLTFDEALDTGDALDRSAFTVTVAGSGRGVDTVAVSGSVVTLTLVTAVVAEDTVIVDYTAPTDESAARLQDLSGNAAESFSGEAVTNNTAPDQTEEPSQTEEESQEQADIPGSPTGLQVARHESGKLLASWTAPDSGPAPTGYTVQWKESGDDWADQDDVSEADVTVTSHIVAGLTDGTEYAVRVIATTDDAESDPSGEVAATPAETTPPELSSATVDGATLTLAYDEQLDIGEAPERSAFAVTVAGSGRGVDTVAVSGSVVTLTMVTAVVAGDAVTVAYTAPTDESAARLQDLSGNAASSFSGEAVTNNTQAADPLTASAHDVPAAHDGSTTFTFEVRFSETPRKGFSYKTLRDHAFTVTSGDVTKARRLEKGKNVRWEIHVTPDGNGTVTIVLPATTDCDADGAVCTDDGRMLSNRLEVTVPGP